MSNVSDPIYTFATWEVKPGTLDTVITLVKELQAKSIQEPGNILYKVYRDRSNTNTLFLYEGYASEEAMELHRNSAHYIEIVTEQIRPLLAERNVVLMTPLDV